MGIHIAYALAVQLPLIVFLLWRQQECLSSWTILVPLVIIYHTFFNLLLAMTVSAANVYFRSNW